MRELVIGDIHGGLRALNQCLDKCKYDSDNDKLIFLGDYVDGWSESSELIEALIIMNKANKNIIFIRGNHDKWCENWLIMGEAPLIWTQQGGQSTIDSYVRTGLLVEDSHRKFFKSLHNYYVDEENRVFVHGGFTSHRGIGHEPYESNYYWDRTLWDTALAQKRASEMGFPYEYMAKRLEKHKEIYLGHTATTNWKAKKNWFDENNKIDSPIISPMNSVNVWNLDTGGGWGGKLTIMDIDTKEFYQSDLVSELYPEEKGRK